MTYVALTDQPLDVAAALRRAETPEAGAVAAFIGTIRAHTAGRAVTRLHYEAYETMALHQLRRLAAQARERWPMLARVVVIHRTGTLEIGEAAVVVAVASPHRAEAFAACQFLIDTLKEVVPIWKHEHYADGTTWVAAHP